MVKIPFPLFCSKHFFPRPCSNPPGSLPATIPEQTRGFPVRNKTLARHCFLRKMGRGGPNPPGGSYRLCKNSGGAHNSRERRYESLRVNLVSPG